MQTETIVVIGLGQLGTLLAELLEKQGAHVVRIGRGDALDPSLVPERVIVAVGEDDLSRVLASLPEPWRDRVVLLQNELVPAQWIAHDVADPTVAVVWFEKKKDQPARVVLPTPIAGPWAEPMARILEGAGLTAQVIERELLAEALLDKNVYILTSNLAGLVAPPGTTTGALLELPLLETTTRVFAAVLAVESRRLGLAMDPDTAAPAMMRAFGADPQHVAAGRTAPARLKRTLARARELRIDAKVLSQLVSS